METVIPEVATPQRVGEGLCVIGRASRLGLGSMTQDFCNAMDPDLVIVIDYNQYQKCDPEGMGLKNYVILDRTTWKGVSLVEFLNASTKGKGPIKTVVGFETFYREDMVFKLKPAGVKTVIFPMWEWTPDYALEADVVINLSHTDQSKHPQGFQVQWPASPAVHVPHRSINWPVKTFVHFAGNASHGRDGTQEVLKAAEHLKGTGARLVVYASFSVPSIFEVPSGCPIDLRGPVPERRNLLDGADCVVCPRGLGGHSLPIDEAQGEGIPVITLNTLDWLSNSYSVTAYGPTHRRFGKVHNAPLYHANTAELGFLMKAMATGVIDRRPQLPHYPWSEFRDWWVNHV